MLHHLVDEMLRFKADGKLMLGICNGFQVLMKSPVLLDQRRRERPGRHADARTTAAGIRTAGCGWKRTATKCVFLAGIERMYLPVAHAEGKFVARDDATLRQLDAAGQLVLRYVHGRQPERRDGRRGGRVRRDRPRAWA